MDLRQHFFKNVALLRMACRRTCARPGRSVLCLAGPRAAPPAGGGQRLAKDRIMTDHRALRLAGKVLPPPLWRLRGDSRIGSSLHSLHTFANYAWLGGG